MDGYGHAENALSPPGDVKKRLIESGVVVDR
jgi:hypothetical protein